MTDAADGDDRDDETAKPSLELPKLGWPRRRPRATPEPAEEPQPQPRAQAAPPPPAPELEDTRLLFAEPAAAPARRTRRLPRPAGMPAAVLTGLLVGLGIVGLTWSSLRGCEAVQGTSSCGGAGYPLLAAVMVAMVVVGALLLRALRLPDPGSTSFLAVGLTAVLALLFLVDSLLDRAMIVVIPLITAACYALAHWVTRTFIEPAER